MMKFSGNEFPPWYYGKYNSSVDRGEQAVLLFGRPKSDDTSC